MKQPGWPPEEPWTIYEPTDVGEAEWSEPVQPDDLRRARLSSLEAERLKAEVAAQRDELRALGITCVRYGGGPYFEIGYTAWDNAEADLELRRRFGQQIQLTYLGATLDTFEEQPFGSWHAEDSLLHVFYALWVMHRPGGARVIETDEAVIVSLGVWASRGPTRLPGGWKPTHLTIQLRELLAGRYVVDDSANRVRPHWTQVEELAEGPPRL